MVLFDKGDYLLKSAKFHKEKKEWLYQLQHATEFSDRADAIVALDKIKNDDEVVAALSTSLNSDPVWGIRSSPPRLSAASAAPPRSSISSTRSTPTKNLPSAIAIVSSIGNFKDNAEVPAKLESIADATTLVSRTLRRSRSSRPPKSADALPVLTAAVTSDSPDDILRNSALRSLGYLGNDKAVPLLVEWSAPGKAVDSRNAAIASLARLDNENKEITQQIATYLDERGFPFDGPSSTHSGRAETPAPSPRWRLC